MRFGRLTIAALVIAALGMATTPAFDQAGPSHELNDYPFGLQHVPVLEGPLWAKFRELKEHVLADIAEMNACREATETCRSPAVSRFVAIVEEARKRNGLARVEAMNRGVNAALIFQNDMSQYRQADKWASPLETFKSGRGDCEDYATAKLVGLYAAGVPLDHLVMVLGYDKWIREYHMMAGVRVDSRWRLLDNRTLTIFDEKNLPDFDPQFLINHVGVLRLIKPTAFFTIASRMPCEG